VQLNRSAIGQALLYAISCHQIGEVWKCNSSKSNSSVERGVRHGQTANPVLLAQSSIGGYDVVDSFKESAVTYGPGRLPGMDVHSWTA
jgi:hypothetical protein